MDNAIILLCGLPGAGKTTLAQQLCEETKSETSLGCTKRVVVERFSFDDLYFKRSSNWTADFDPVKWKVVQDEMVTIVKDRISQSCEREAGACRVLLVDDNFYYRSMRKRFYHIAEEGGCGFGVLYVATPEITSRKRNAARKGASRVPEAQFERMLRAFEPPDRSFAFESNFVVLGNTFDATYGSAIADDHTPSSRTEFLWRVLHQAAKHLEAARLARQTQNGLLRQQLADQQRTAESTVHHFDMISRRWISSVLNGGDAAFAVSTATEKALLAKALNERRKAFLLDMKSMNSSIASRTLVAGGSPMQLLEHFRVDMIQQLSTA